MALQGEDDKFCSFLINRDYVFLTLFFLWIKSVTTKLIDGSFSKIYL
jgi:hypothetical protein